MIEKSKSQIIKYPAHATCETYGCRKKVIWAVGRPDGPKQLWKFYCDDCIRDVIASIPPELLPDIDTEDNSIEAKRDKLLSIIKELLLVDDAEFQEGLLDEIIEAFGGLEPEPEDDKPDEQKPICQYCGKECKNNAGLQAHERTCKEKGVKADG